MQKRSVKVAKLYPPTPLISWRTRLRRVWTSKKINFTKLYARNFGKVPYFDVETGTKADLRKSLNPDSREPGISGFMRLRNEEEYVERAIESVIDSLDELVVVHNACSDRTPEIVESCRLRYPERIHVYKYEPLVYRPASREHRSLPMDSPHSLVNYYNYSLAKTTRKTAVKIDGDQLFFPERLKQVMDNIRAGGLSKPRAFQGINLWDEDGEIFVNANHPVISGVDNGLFSVSGRTFFVHHATYELFTYALERSLGILFFHLKGMKRDRGLGNYEMEADKTSLPQRTIRSLTSPKLISWTDFQRMMPEALALPEPSTLGLRPRRGS